MKRIVITFAGKNEMQAAGAIERSVKKFLADLGYQDAVVQVKRYRSEQQTGEEGRGMPYAQ